MTMIVFVCRANRFRSPLAAACFRKELVARGMGDDWRVVSAGIGGTGRLPAVSMAVDEASRRGMDISEHASQGVHEEEMSAADLVIVMEKGQKNLLQTAFPGSASKVYLLSEVTTGKDFDIPDPGPATSAADVTNAIERLIHNGFDRICALLGPTG